MSFSPRDDMLARYFLSSCVCLSVWLAVCHKPVLCRNDWTNRADFGMWVSFYLSYIVLLRNSSISKNKDTSPRIFAPNSGLRKFRRSNSIVFSTKLVDGRACWRHLRRSTRRGCLLHTRRPPLTVNPSNSIISICCGFVVQLNCSDSCAWKFDWHSGSRGLSCGLRLFAIQEHLVSHLNCLTGFRG